MCLYIPEEKLLFSGDHVLFDITPNICAVAPGDDMLGEYLSSLEKIRKLDIAVTLPAHRGTGNVDVYSRIDALEAHHQKRLEEVLDIVRRSDGINAYTLTGLMRWNIRAKSWRISPPGRNGLPWVRRSRIYTGSAFWARCAASCLMTAMWCITPCNCDCVNL